VINKAWLAGSLPAAVVLAAAMAAPAAHADDGIIVSPQGVATQELPARCLRSSDLHRKSGHQGALRATNLSVPCFSRYMRMPELRMSASDTTQSPIET
jgi:hypothetical protein